MPYLLLILGRAFKNWWGRDPLSQSAAAAYYAVFSLPGLLIIIMTIAAMAYEQSSAETQALSHVQNVLGADVAQTMRAILQSARHKNGDILAMSVGAFTLFFGTTGLFVQLQKSLNQVWDVEIKKGIGFLIFLKARVTALGITICLGLLLLLSLILTAALAALSNWLTIHLSQDLVYYLYSMNFFMSLIILSLLFTLIHKILPDIHLKWRDALRGGIVSAVLFKFGEYGLGLYFRLAQPESVFGAAGSIILFLIWVFYSCLVLLYGAEFIRSSIEFMQSEKPKPSHLADEQPNQS